LTHAVADLSLQKEKTMILTVTPNPCVDKTVFIDELRVGTFMRASRCTCIPGGKGANVSRAIKNLGRATRALVVVGGHPGAHVVEMIEQQDGVECLPVWVADRTRTITTVLEEKGHRQTAFFEPGPRVTPEEELKIEETFCASLPGARVVTFNGTVSDPAIGGIYARLIRHAADAGAITILDSHGPELAHGLEAVPFMCKPNIAEAEELVGYSLDTDKSRLDAVDCFHEKGVNLVVLSLGKGGAIVSDGAIRLRAVPPEIKEVNPVGSGDALVAGFAIGLMEGMSLKDTAKLAIAAGAANAMSWDIGHFDRTLVENLSSQVSVISL
jgi:tagatose 6-phosphate kinase